MTKHTPLFLALLLMLSWTAAKAKPIDGISTAYLVFDSYSKKRMQWNQSKIYLLPSDKTFFYLSHTPQVTPALIMQLAVFAKDKNALFYVVDSRLEPHGFLNNQPISWYNTNFNQWTKSTATSALEVEAHVLEKLKEKETVKIFHLEKNKSGQPRLEHYSVVDVDSVCSEQELVSQHGGIYIRIPICDHQASSAADIDIFLDVLKNISKHDILHIHCRGGRGRSQLLDVVCRIFFKAQHVTLDEIFAESNKVFGREFQILASDSKQNRKLNAFLDKMALVEGFYTYCKTKTYDKMSFQEFLEKRSSDLDL